MKHAQYNREPISAKFRLTEPIQMPIMTAIPSIVSHHLQPNDSFLIFASDGLWEHLTNETAVDIVHSHPHAVRFYLYHSLFFCSMGYFCSSLECVCFILCFCFTLSRTDLHDCFDRENGLLISIRLGNT